MTSEFPIEQAIYSNAGTGGYRFQARSRGFTDDWLPEAEKLCAGFGERPADVACPECVFARPFGKDHVAVVQVADQGQDDAGRPGALGFRLLILPRQAYVTLIGDPFFMASSFPPNWQDKEELPTLTWPAEPLPGRTVEQIQKVLKEGNGPVLLGGVQALVDGCRLVFERPAPATPLMRDLWTLLPSSTRCNLWPASFAFGNSLAFDVLVVPKNNEGQGYLTEEQSADYPQGRYELNLQIAAEDGNQRALDALLARRNSVQTLKLSFILLIAISIIAVVARWLTAPERPVVPQRPVRHITVPPIDGPFPALGKEMSAKVVKRIHELNARLGYPEQPQHAALKDMIQALDQQLGTPDPERYCGKIGSHKRSELQLRVILWKNHVQEFNDRSLNALELVERLEKKLLADRAKKSD